MAPKTTSKNRGEAALSKYPFRENSDNIEKKRREEEAIKQVMGTWDLTLKGGAGRGKENKTDLRDWRLATITQVLKTGMADG